LQTDYPNQHFKGYTQVAKRRLKIAGKSGEQCDENGTCELHFKD